MWTEYDNSILITAKLTDQILNLKYRSSDQHYTRTMKSKVRQEKNARYCNCWNKLFEQLTTESQQHIKGAMQTGAFSWLSALPIKAIRL